MNWTELYQKRINICKQCEHFDAPMCRCKKCGCLMKFKARVPAMKCPIDKWGKEETK